MKTEAIELGTKHPCCRDGRCNHDEHDLTKCYLALHDHIEAMAAEGQQLIAYSRSHRPLPHDILCTLVSWGMPELATPAQRDLWLRHKLTRDNEMIQTLLQSVGDKMSIIERSGFDLCPCGYCGETVLSIGEGAAYCKDCIEKVGA